MRERNEWSTTWQGRYFNFLGYFFSIYCIWKIFISTINIVFDRVGKVRNPWYNLGSIVLDPELVTCLGSGCGSGF
jgi:hypothetical protein